MIEIWNVGKRKVSVFYGSMKMAGLYSTMRLKTTTNRFYINIYFGGKLFHFNGLDMAHLRTRSVASLTLKALWDSHDSFSKLDICLVTAG